jgi:predicted nucleic acid-binding protein
VIVVSDTSPLNYLILIHTIDVLPTLFTEIYAPPKVIEELQRSRTPDLVRAWAQMPPPWLHLSTPSTAITTSVRLHPGELPAIALAKELQADAILIDERKGWRVASEHGLKAIGTLNVLEFAAERKLLDLMPVLESLRRTTFYITDEYINAALQRDSARRGP